MKHSMAIKLIMKRRRVNRQQVAEKLGAPHAGRLFQSIYNEHIYINRMVEVLDALEYQLVFQPKREDGLPEGAYPIRWSDYQEK